MNTLDFTIKEAVNEPIKDYLPGSAEKASLKDKLEELKSQTFDIPIIINGQEIRTGNTGNCVMPHDHQHILATYHKAGEKEIEMAINSALSTWKDWSFTPLKDRIAIFHKMADLLQGPYRDLINGSTMLGQSKNVFQAEIDAACELIDFLNFNCEYLYNIHKQQPKYSPEGMQNSTEYRALEGFVFAVTPFNFTSIAANLSCAPALLGNVALFKPASSCVYSGYFLMQLFKEAGLPDGVINFVPGSGSQIGKQVLKHPDLAGIHFTGSTGVFQTMWNTVGSNIKNYKSYPRIVGETGGKDFILAHTSSNRDGLRTAMVRGAFEYQGQKCSAASRCYLPENVWNDIKDDYISDVKSIKMGDVQDFTNFMNAVIDETSFDNIVSYIEHAKQADDATIITGGGYDKSKGYFIEPTTILTTNPHFKSMEEEIFGPVLTIYIYNQSWEDVCKLVDSTSPYALTGAIFGDNKNAINTGRKLLMHSAGNFYINDKPTGAVVGQQPFGGSRASGTNDKAGAPANLLRWTSQRTVKETFTPPTNYKYPFMEEK
ncbi:MAG: 1-pyrroline-5-carboxylate dehydrogenase [Candidatus Marinimicrobia bacterium]|nr:1-pyrroline-5-carboxylate dehydrogenase [Candidatus Neomarinimicrobiota bacterium]|tara:strand:- start:26856 stop:28487 length:1632 start_codon:yes stop_codon:yes gene_type:complete